jgi:hypothetical protein
MNQLARSANSGSLLVNEVTEREIHEAASQITEMRRLLMEALSLDAT